MRITKGGPYYQQKFDEYEAAEEDVKEIIEEQPPQPDPPKQELLPISAAEMEQQILTEKLDSIAKGQALYLEAQHQKKINEHYARRAKKLLEKIWGECHKRTKHNNRRSLGNDLLQCKTCSAPLWKDAYGKIKINNGEATVAIINLAREMRAADQAAGVEWIP